MRFFRTALAFVRKDFQEDSSYRFSFLFGLGHTLLTLLFLVFVSDFFGSRVDDQLDGHGQS